MAEHHGPAGTTLELVLLDVGTHLDDPQPVGLATAVRARLREEPAGARGIRWPRFAIAGVVLAVGATLVLALSAGTRDAVAGWLGLRGVSIEDRDELPATDLGGDLALGGATTLTDARADADFRVLAPHGFGAPDEVYVADTVTGSRVTLLYHSRDDLPPASASGVGLLLTEFRADVPEELVRKAIDSGVRLEEVRVAGARGYWFEGEPHILSFADEQGRFFEEESRLAGNTLIWERGPVTLRLESGLSRVDAIRVAESLTQ